MAKTETAPVITVEYSPNIERMLRALMSAVGLSREEIHDILAKHQEEKRRNQLDRSAA